MKIEKLNQLYEGKAKKVFETSDPEGQAQLHLGLGQRHPQLSPRGVAGVVGKQLQHRGRRIASLQGALVGSIGIGHKIGDLLG